MGNMSSLRIVKINGTVANGTEGLVSSNTIRAPV
jgi:hypothetical protein